MNTKIKFGVCLVFVGVCVKTNAQFASDEKLFGKWKVFEITLEKDTDGKKETLVFNTSFEARELVRFPEELDIKDAHSMVLRYADSVENIGAKYALENNQLKITAVGTLLECLYRIDDKVLLLEMEHSYTSNLPAGKTERITERWTFRLRKQ